MENKRTFNSVVNDLNTAVRERQILTPELWMEAALILNLLIESEEQPKLFELQQTVALAEVVLKENAPEMSDKTVERITRSKPIWKDLMKQQARIKMAEKLILLAKRQASLSSELMRNNL